MKEFKFDEKIAVVIALVVVAIFIVGMGIFRNQAQDLTNDINMNDERTATIPGEEGELQIQDTVIGEGEVAEAGDLVTVHYVGKLENGTVFDSSVQRGEPFTFALGAGQVIPGWEEGVAGMKEGGVRMLTIPPNMAYGAQQNGPIPPNSTLEFEVQLLGVEKAQ